MSLSDEEALFEDIYEEEEPKVIEEPEEEEEEILLVKEDDLEDEPAKDGYDPAKKDDDDDDAIDSNDEAGTRSSSAPEHAERKSAMSGVDRADLSRDAGKMFIGGLDWDTTEDSMKEYFSQFGEVIDHTIMREPSTGRSRGFGFLTFAEKSSVDKVLRQQHVLDGKVIDPKRSIPREEQNKTGKIFVGGLPPDVRPHEFEAYFAKFGEIIDAQLMLDKDTGRSRGFGFVTFDSPEAVDKVCQNRYLDFEGKQIEVKRAEPRGGQQQHNHQQQQQQQQQQQRFTQQPGVDQNASPEAMAEYFQRLQQYWAMMQQQQQQQQQQQHSGGGAGFAGQMPQMPQMPTGPGGMDLPSGPGGFPRGPGRDGFRGGRGRGGRGRGGRGHDQGGRGGYHPYNR